MNKQLLIQYNDLIKEKKKLEKRIERLEKQSSMVSDVVQNGYKRHAVIFGYDLSRSNKLNELKQILVERDAQIIIDLVEIEKFISTIKESEVRQIFEHRYIDNMEWHQVAQVMNYSGESIPRMRHDRYLEKIL